MTHIAILGFGTVGSGVADLILKNKALIDQKINDSINVKYILDIKDISEHPLGDRCVRDIDVILKDPEVTIVAEMMGGSHPAYDFSKAALEAGKSVVTSNKEVVANFGEELLKIAAEHQVRYMFEASTGGAIPIIRPLNTCLAANNIVEICGILNGTTNYILTQMIENNKSFEAALSEAQQKGYAEANPSADIMGIDSCRKICILTAQAYGKIVSCSAVDTTGITEITLKDVENASKIDGAIKLIGRTRKNADGKIYIIVAPHIVKKSNPLANVNDVFNAILVKGDASDDIMFYGSGAGKFPTASAVVGDIIDVARQPKTGNTQMLWCAAGQEELADMGSNVTEMYLSFSLTNMLVDEAEINRLFGAVNYIEKTEEVLSFVTEAKKEKDIAEAIASLELRGAKLTSKLRILK